VDHTSLNPEKPLGFFHLFFYAIGILENDRRVERVSEKGAVQGRNERRFRPRGGHGGGGGETLLKLFGRFVGGPLYIPSPYLLLFGAAGETCSG